VSWEAEAANWIAWTRKPGHDAYWWYRDSFFDLLPAAGGRTLEIGCGEGRVVRDLAARGHRVVGIDSAPTMLAAAREADPDGEYVLADAAALPFADGEFDLVVAYNSLMDIEDMAGAVREASRVLVPDGRLCLCITHPLADAGGFEARTPDAAFLLRDTYFGRRTFEGTFESAGLTITFRGWVYPFEDYARALEDAGFVFEALREPPAPAAWVESSSSQRRWQRVPNFLMARALKVTTASSDTLS
jgi:SAM-dependent methyltransferase